MAENQSTVFRKKTLERISSPEQLTDYLRVTTPSVWVILVAMILLLAGILAWATVGILETKAEVKVVVDDHTALVIPLGGETVAEGMKLSVAGREVLLDATVTDGYGHVYGTAEISLTDGTYTGTVVTETTRPIEFLLTSR